MTTPERSVEEIVEEFYSAFKDPKGDFWMDDFNSNPSHVADWLNQALQAERQKREEVVEYGRVSVLEDFDSLMKADGFIGLTNDEWKAVQKFFRYNDEISGWKITQPNN